MLPRGCEHKTTNFSAFVSTKANVAVKRDNVSSSADCSGASAHILCALVRTKSSTFFSSSQPRTLAFTDSDDGACHAGDLTNASDDAAYDTFDSIINCEATVNMTINMPANPKPRIPTPDPRPLIPWLSLTFCKVFIIIRSSRTISRA